MSRARAEPLGPLYPRLWTASAISNLGDGVAAVAWPWLASLLTRDPMLIAAVAIALRLPWLLVSLPAGVITDRLDRRRLVLAMDIFRGALLTLLAIWIAAGAPYPPAGGALAEVPGLLPFMIVAAFVAGCAEVLRDNAAQTLMPALVPKSRLEDANGRMWSAEVLMNALIGPPLAGFLIAAALPLAFFLDAATFLISAALILTIRGSFRAPPRDRRHWLVELKEGAAYLWHRPLLRRLALALGCLNAAHSAVLVSLVLFAQEALGLSPAAYGAMLTGEALGGILGGLFAGRVARALGPGTALRVVLLLSVAQYLVIGLAASPAPVWAVLVVGSAAGMLWNSITVSLRQRMIPDALLGRVNSVYRFFGWGMMPVGMLAGAASVRLAETMLAREAALRVPFLLAALATVVLAAAVWRGLSNARLTAACQ